MSTSQNGYPANDASLTTIYTIGKGRQVRLAKGAPGALLVRWANWFDANVEDIDATADDWGYAERTIRGDSTTLSNHASGTALDLNATRHPLGQRGTFTKAQTAAIRAELLRYGGAIRWGGDYANRADEMHFEINAPLATVQRVLSQLEDDMATPDEIWAEAIKAAGDRHASVVLGQVWREVFALKAALSALAAGMGPAVEKAVKDALAEGVVDVDVTVHDNTEGA